jgi:hypothetical protein
MTHLSSPFALRTSNARLVISTALVFSAIAAYRQTTAAAESAGGNPWVGEWTFGNEEREGGHISIRDCLADKCRVILTARGSGGSCEHEFGKDPTSEKIPRVLILTGKKARAELKAAWGKSICSVDLMLDDTRQPPQISTHFAESGCDHSCRGRPTFPAFVLRSRKPYLQYETYRNVGVCYKDDSAAIQAWCTDEKVFSLYRTWSLRQAQLYANLLEEKGQEYGLWQEDMLQKCKGESRPVACFSEAYQQKIGELTEHLYGRFQEGRLSGEQVLSAIYPQFDPRTARTGRRTDINTKGEDGEEKGKLKDEILVFFKIAEPTFMPGHMLVLDTVSDDFDGWQSKSYFSLLKAENGRLKIVARESIRGEPDWVQEPDTLPWRGGRSGHSLKLDLANYRINDRERAFGYRLALWDGGTGADYGTETLVLFRLVGEKMQQVLNIAMESHDAAWDNSEGKVYKDKKEHLVLIVGSNRHDGNYDWIVKGKIINKRTHGAKAAKTRTYIWKGNAYVADTGD